MKIISTMHSKLLKAFATACLTANATAVMALFPTGAYSAEPLTENDMGNISLESASLERLLGIDGSTAAGEDYIVTEESTRDIENSVSQAKTDSDRLEKAATENDGRQPVIAPANPKAENHNTVVASVTRTSHGEALTIIEPRLRIHDSTSNHSNNLNLQGSATIQRVQIENARDSSNAIRGSYYISNIQSGTNAVINGR